MIPTPSQIKLIALAAVAVGLFVGGWQVRSWYDGAQQAARLEELEKARIALRDEVGAVAVKTEEAIKGIRVENRTIYAKTQREVVEKPVYRDCVLPDDGVRLANEARRGAAAGKPDRKLRRSAPAE